MVRLAHVSDTHLGLQQYNLDEREQDIYDVMDEIADKILEEDVDIVIHSGDLFDSPRPSAQAYYTFKRFLAKLNNKARIFSILGDHDTPKRRGMPPQKLFDERIQILGLTEGECQVLNLDGKEVLVAGISFVGRRYKDVLVDELKKLDSLAKKYSISILALHQAIEKFFAVGEAFELRMDELPRNFNYYAFGHLHNRIRASFGRGELAYAGSTEILRVNEVDEWKERGKGFYVVDIYDDEVKVKEVNLENIRPQLKVKINYARFDEELKKILDLIGVHRKLPIVHVIVEGKDIDRQSVQQTLNETLADKVLYFRLQFSEEAERRLTELKPGDININILIKEYFKDEDEAGLALDLFRHLRLEDIEEAKRVADEYFRRMKQNAAKRSTS